MASSPRPAALEKFWASLTLDQRRIVLARQINKMRLRLPELAAIGGRAYAAKFKTLPEHEQRYCVDRMVVAAMRAKAKRRGESLIVYKQHPDGTYSAYDDERMPLSAFAPRQPPKRKPLGAFATPAAPDRRPLRSFKS